MPKEGQVWPLQLIFVLLLVLAVLSISAPTAFSITASIGSPVVQILLWIASSAVAILLYLPAVRECLAVRSLITTQIGDPNEPTSLSARLQTIQTQTAKIGDVNTQGMVLQRLTALETKLSDIGTKVEDGIKSLRDEIAKAKGGS